MSRIEAYLAASGIRDESGFRPELIRDLQDGTYVMARPLLFHWMLIRGDFDNLIGYFDRWCYSSEAAVLRALAEFPEAPAAEYEPSGWHRHPATGRRRPEGDPTGQFVES